MPQIDTYQPTLSPIIAATPIKSTQNHYILGFFLFGGISVLYILHSICKHRRKRRLSIIQQDDDDVSVNSQEF